MCIRDSRKGGNPSNDPALQAAYIARIEESYHTTKLHPCVVAFSLAEDSANGVNLYEGYLHLKGLEKERPVLYPDAGGDVYKRQGVNSAATTVRAPNCPPKTNTAVIISGTSNI